MNCKCIRQARSNSPLPVAWLRGTDLIANRIGSADQGRMVWNLQRSSRYRRQDSVSTGSPGVGLNYNDM